MTLFIENGILNYEYNLFELERTKFKGNGKLPLGKAAVELLFEPKPHASKPFLQSADLTITVNGVETLKGHIPTIITAGFSANECFDLGTDLGSPVSESYYEKAPFQFNGTIKGFETIYLKQ